MQEGPGAVGIIEIIFLFRIMRFLPYIAGGLLIVAIAILIIFGIKKFRWVKIATIVLAVVSIVIGFLGFLPIVFQKNLTERIPGDRLPLEERPSDNGPDRKDASLGETIIFNKSTADEYIININ